MECDQNGVPILRMGRKLDALAWCVKEGAWEDAAGHLCDLLEHARGRIKPSDGSRFESLQAMLDYYGKSPTPIKEDGRDGA